MAIHATSVRDFIKEVQLELQPGVELSPAKAREMLVALTALLGNCLVEIRTADTAYAKVLLACLDSEERANRAKIRAQCSDEYRRLCEAKDMREMVVEMVRGLKYYLRSLDEEMRLSR